MRILIVMPASAVHNGNVATAEQWAEDVRILGHEVRLRDCYDGGDADLLVVLHGAKNHHALAQFQAAHPVGKVALALTGTDLYPEPSAAVEDAMRRSDRIVTLQARARDRVPPGERGKVRVIPLAARPPAVPFRRRDEMGFLVSVVGNLREVKDPMRTAEASRLLPPQSRLAIRHAGAILDDRFAEAVEREKRENPRYTWLGEVTPDEAQDLIAESDLFVLSSYYEGGGRVLSEAAVAGTPILAARSDAVFSALGEDYPGLFDAGDTAQLAEMLRRAETDPHFLDDLRAGVRAAAAQFDPAREVEAWRELLAELGHD